MWFEKVSFSCSISTRHEIIINKVRKEYKLSQSFPHMLNINEICLFLFLFLFQKIKRTSTFSYEIQNVYYIWFELIRKRGRYDRDRGVVGFKTTYAISAYHH